MFAQSLPSHLKYVAGASLLITLTAAILARTAWAAIATNTIDPMARLNDQGRSVVVTGPIQCSQGERSLLRVTVTQRSTGAMAEGVAVVACTGTINRWTVRASGRTQAAFAEGPATVVALARTVERGESTDAHQWLVPVTLVRP